MEIISKKAQEIVVRNATVADYEDIVNFHRLRFTFLQMGHIKISLSSLSGLSFVAYENQKLEGHILLVPITSRSNIYKEEAVLIVGTWYTSNKIEELLIREAIKYAWEIGFDAVFCLQNKKCFQSIGFEKIEKKFFIGDISKYSLYGMELSWNAFANIPKDLTVPRVYFPPIDKTNSFSTN